MTNRKPSFQDPLLARVVNKLVTKFRATPMGLSLHAKLNSTSPKFHCPVCEFKGPFVTLEAVYGRRLHAQCPRCGALERHRLMVLAMRDAEARFSFTGRDVLHFAPEPFFSGALKARSRTYRTSDLVMRNVDMRADMTDIPVESESIDLLIASYILQYVSDDLRALREIRRVLRPGGLAILPVTIVSDRTVEYPEPNLHESGGHVRAPGEDYFDRMSSIFSEVELKRSSDYPETYQTWVYEDRSQWPTPEMPLRRPMPGERHLEYIPLCWR